MNAGPLQLSRLEKVMKKNAGTLVLAVCFGLGASRLAPVLGAQ
jgi:hypothetical protein